MPTPEEIPELVVDWSIWYPDLFKEDRSQQAEITVEEYQAAVRCREEEELDSFWEECDRSACNVAETRLSPRLSQLVPPPDFFSDSAFPESGPQRLENLDFIARGSPNHEGNAQSPPLPDPSLGLDAVLARSPSLPVGQSTLTSYLGDPDNPRNQCADIPEHESCSVYLTGLPPNCTINMLLSPIRGVGKIFQSSTTPPNGRHATSAAKIVFWQREALDRFAALCQAGRYVVASYRPRLTMNRIRVASQKESPASRVVQVEGPSHTVTRESLEWLFSRCFYYDLDDVVVLPSAVGRTRIEFRFASYRCQAEVAYRLLKNDAGLVRVFWGADPCASDHGDCGVF